MFISAKIAFIFISKPTVHIHDFHVFTIIYSSLHGFITHQHNDQLPVSLLAQLVEHCTDVAEFICSNPIQKMAWTRGSIWSCRLIGWLVFVFVFFFFDFKLPLLWLCQAPISQRWVALLFDLRPVSRAFFPKVTTTEIFNTTEESRQVCCHNLHSIAGWTVHQVEWGRGFTFGSSSQLIAAWLGRKQKVSVNRSRWAFFVTHKISGKNHVSHNWCHHVPICYSIELVRTEQEKENRNKSHTHTEIRFERLRSLWTGVRLRVTLLWYKLCCSSNENSFVIMLTRYWSLPQHGQLQSHSKSKAWQPSTQL